MNKKAKHPVGWNNNFDQFFQNFDNLFNQSITNFIGVDHQQTQPSVNVWETETDFQIELAAPGLQKEDFSIEVKDEHLILRAEKEVRNETNDANYTRKEFNYTSFSRQFQLPDTVDVENIAATYEAGVLKVTLPRKVDVKLLPKRIEVK